MNRKFSTLSWLALALALASGTAAAQADDASAVAGEWKLAITAPDGQTFQPTLKLAVDGDKLSGTFLGDDGSENPVQDATFSGGELAFSVTLDFGGQQLTSKYRGTVADGALKGTLDYDLGGQTGTLDFTGARPVSLASVLGNWKLVASSPDGQTFEPGLALRADGDKLAGDYTWIDGTTIPISDAALEGDQLRFNVEIDFGGQAMKVAFKSKVAAGKLSGTADYDLGGQTGTVDVTGEMQAAGSLAGTWNLVATSPDGQSFEPTLHLKQDGSSLSGKFVWIDGTEIDLADGKLDGQAVKFQVAIDFGGQAMTVAFTGNLEGDAKMAGTADYDLGGQTGTIDFTGTKAAEAATSLAGRWNIVASSPDGQTFEPYVTVVDNAGALSGKFVWVDGTEIDITQAKLEGKKLSFTVAVDFGGNPMTLNFQGDVDGDKLAGTADYDFGGQTGTVDITATKAGVDVAGHWNIVASSPDGQSFEPSIDLEQSGGDVKGKFNWIDGTQIDVTGGKLTGNELVCPVSIDFGGQAMTVTFKGQVDGDKMTGTADYDLGGQTGTIDFTAERGAAASPLVGTWNFTLSSDDGQTFDTSLEVKQDGDALSGQYKGPLGEAATKDLKLDGDTLSFSVVRERDGTEFTTSFKGTVSGDSVSGEASFDAGGQSRSMKFEGKKAGG